MKTASRAFLPIALLPLLLSAEEAPRGCTVCELNEVRLSTTGLAETLVATGTVQTAKKPRFILSDDSGYVALANHDFEPPVPGSVVEVFCSKVCQSDHDKFLVCNKWTILGTAPITPPLGLRLGDLDEQRHDLRTVTVEGLVVDVVRDEIDKDYCILLLKDGAATLPCFIRREQLAQQLPNARIRLTGTYHRLVSGFRRFSGPHIEDVSDLSILRPAPTDLLDVPAIDPCDYITPKDIAQMGRRSLVGTVLATWGSNQAMLRVGHGVVNAVFARDTLLPPCGATVKVAGYPGTDLFRIILSKCVWAQDDTQTDESPEDPSQAISPAQALLKDATPPRFNAECHGQLIRLRGVVSALPGEGSADRRLLVEADGFRIPVDYSSSPTAADGIVLGCEVEATGRCLLESENWRPYEVLPQISGLAVVLRTPADLRVLRRPPWWTPQRLLTLIFALLAVLLGSTLWNFALKRKAEKRGKALYDEKIGHALAEQKVEERTRLAVELHDSVSQTLTGVALQLDGGEIETAKTMLASCRGELRRCLWDLRSRTFEEKDMTEAVTRTVKPHLNGCAATVRFNVPREMLSESLTHAILRIVRELVVNAIRHGQAKRIRIAGELHDRTVSFSVADDGLGFDPETAPGPEQGHFGLLGIRERIENFNGSLKIASAPDRGAKFTVTLILPDETNER